MKKLTMLDGRNVVAPTWEDVEKDWSNLFMNQLAPPGQFRQEIQARARVWSGTEIIVSGSAYDFLQEAERAGLVYGMSDHYQPGLPALIQRYVPLARVVYLDGIAAKQIERKLNAAGS